MKKIFFICFIMGICTGLLSQVPYEHSINYRFEINSISDPDSPYIALKIFACTAGESVILTDGICLFTYDSGELGKLIVSSGKTKFIRNHSGLFGTDMMNNPIYQTHILKDQDSTRFGLAFEIHENMLDSGIVLEAIPQLIAEIKILYDDSQPLPSFQWAESIMDGESYVYTDDEFQPVAVQTQDTCIATTSIRDEFTYELNMFPNPGNGILNVELPEEFQGFTINILDLRNRLLLSKQYNRKEFLKLDLRSYPTGFYLISCTNGQRIYVGKYLKH